MAESIVPAAVEGAVVSPLEAETATLLQEILQEEARTPKYYWGFGANVRELTSFQRARNLPPADRTALALATVAHFKATYHSKVDRATGWYHRSQQVELSVLPCLLECSEDLAPEDYVALLYSYLPSEEQIQYWNAFTCPVGQTLRLLEKSAKGRLLPEAVRQDLQKLLELPAFLASHHYEMLNAFRQIRRLLVMGTDREGSGSFSEEDSFGKLLLTFAATQEAHRYQPLLRLWAQATGSKPTQKFSKLATQHIQAVGAAEYAAQATEWLAFLEQKDHDTFSYATTYGDRHYETTDSVYLSEANLVAAKGLVWSVLGLGVVPEAVLQLVAELAAKCYRKIAGVGPWCSALGNACVLVLSQAGLPGAAHLSLLRTKTTNLSIQKVLDKRLAELGTELGLAPADLEDLAIPTYSLTEGRSRHEFGEYYAELAVTSPAKIELQWYKADGAVLKAAPTALKKSEPAAVKVLQKKLTQVQLTLTAQRDRLERSYLTNREWSYERLQSCYLHHALLGPMTQALIWRFTLPDGQQQDGLWRAGAWHDAQGQLLPEPPASARVRLWHPVLAPVADVLAWRILLEQYQVGQPFKQAYREVYLLTPPEEQTATYSNRMAAHILKQHQFSALAKQRGWHYRLMGGFDHGSDGATYDLPGYGLGAAFWLSEVADIDALSDSGMYRYVATDQVRFTRHLEVVPLTEVPPLVFSEVMRDVDLFVGVSSVGNDPQWRDTGGLPAYRNYWENYSFGELGEVAKNRKLALERLVPRLKIGKVSQIQDRFLVVRGKLRTYKIHLGSGNILMEPNDQYLCIVPDRSAKAPSASDVFLPFEGDAVLSIILSKALLLMDDDKIADDTITRQIQG